MSTNEMLHHIHRNTINRLEQLITSARNPGAFLVGYKYEKGDNLSSVNAMAKFLTSAYTEGTYNDMTADTGRNKYFDTVIRHCSKENTVWFEIGPGAHACLTKMVLSANEHNVILAVEGNRDAAISCRGVVRSYGKRIKVVHGYIGNEKRCRYMGYFNKPCNVILAEIVGHIASNENIVSIIAKFAEQNTNIGKYIKEAVPRFFGTCIVPINLSRTVPARMRMKIYAICPTHYLLENVPFAHLAAFNSDPMGQCFEAFDMLHIIQNPAKYRTTSRESKLMWQNTTQDAETVHGLCTYMFIGNPCNMAADGNFESRDAIFTKFCADVRRRTRHGAEAGLWTTNNVTVHYGCPKSTNWAHVFFPLPDGWVVEVGETLSIKIVTHFTDSISYSITVTLGVKTEHIQLDPTDLILAYENITDRT